MSTISYDIMLHTLHTLRWDRALLKPNEYASESTTWTSHYHKTRVTFMSQRRTSHICSLFHSHSLSLVEAKAEISPAQLRDNIHALTATHCSNRRRFCCAGMDSKQLGAKGARSRRIVKRYFVTLLTYVCMHTFWWAFNSSKTPVAEYSRHHATFV